MSVITFLPLIHWSFIIFALIGEDYETAFIMMGVFFLIFIPYLIFGGYKKIKKNIMIFNIARNAFKNAEHLPLSRISELLGLIENDIKNTNLFSISHWGNGDSFRMLQSNSQNSNSFTGVFTEENSINVYNIRFKEQLNKKEFKLVAHVVF